MKNIMLVDKQDVHQNRLQVMRQYTPTGGKSANRYDVTILVNCLPLVHVGLHTYTIINAISDQNVLPFHLEYVRTMREKDGVEDATVEDIDRERVMRDPKYVGNDGTNKDGKRVYSTYAEVNVPFNLVDCQWTATAGCMPWYTTSYATTGFAVTNLSLKATKDIRVTDSFTVPVFGQIVANPCSQNAYLVFGFTLQP